MATDSAARSIQVGLPELLQVFYAQYLSCPNQRGEGFAISIASPFSPSEQETLNEASSYWAFLKEASTVLLLGAVCRCTSPDSEKGLTILLVFIVSRSTSIWYLLETFQSWLKGHVSSAVWSLWPCQHLTLSSVRGEHSHTWEMKLLTVLAGFLGSSLRGDGFFGKYTPHSHTLKPHRP